MKNTDKDVDEILNSLNGIQPATANHFLYQRIRAKMQLANNNAAFKKTYALAFALIIFLAVNIFTIVSLYKPAIQNTNASIQSFANDYAITTDNY